MFYQVDGFKNCFHFFVIIGKTQQRKPRQQPSEWRSCIHFSKHEFSKSPLLLTSGSIDAIHPGGTHNMKVAHVALKQRPPSKLLKAQLSEIFQGIFSPAPIPGDCACHSVHLCECVLFAHGGTACLF